MTLDIAIALFAKTRQMQGDTPRRPIYFGRAPVSGTMISRPTQLDRKAKRMRYSAHRRSEQHTKQVQMLINQRNFAQNENWKSEYDRLRGSGIQAEDQARIDARIDDLLKAGLELKQ